MGTVSAAMGVVPPGAGALADRPSNARALTFALAFVAFAVLFYEWLWKQHRFSMERPEDWGHSWLVPVITAYLIYLRREPLRSQRPARPLWPALALIPVTLLIYLAFVLVYPNHMFQGYAIVLTVLASALFLYGLPAFRHLVLPLGYLGMAATISERVMNLITYKLQDIAAIGAQVCLDVLGAALGFTTSRVGNVVEVLTSDGAVHPLNIAQACSGMRMVIAFIALGAAVALAACPRWWQRITLVMLSVPLAVALNVVRVVVLGLLTLVDPDLAAGNAHTLIGTILLLPGIAVFFGIVWVLRRIVIDPQPATKPAVEPWPRVLARSLPALRPTLVLLITFILARVAVSTTIAVIGAQLDKLPIHPASGLAVSSLPQSLGNWSRARADEVLSAELVEELGTSNYLSRTYIRPSTDDPKKFIALELHVAYYTGQIDTVPHVPDRCFVGSAGMSIRVPMGTYSIPLNDERWMEDTALPDALQGRIFTAPTSYEGPGRGTRTRLPLGVDNLRARIGSFEIPGRQQTVHALYFFVANGEVVASPDEVRLKAFNLSDRYAYYCKVQITARSDSGVESAQAMAELSADLLSHVLPDLSLALPDWVEVVEGRWPKDTAPDASPQATPPSPQPR